MLKCITDSLPPPSSLPLLSHLSLLLAALMLIFLSSITSGEEEEEEGRLCQVEAGTSMDVITTFLASSAPTASPRPAVTAAGTQRPFSCTKAVYLYHTDSLDGCRCCNCPDKPLPLRVRTNRGKTLLLE